VLQDPKSRERNETDLTSEACEERGAELEVRVRIQARVGRIREDSRSAQLCAELRRPLVEAKGEWETENISLVSGKQFLD
jgi:hypothetical protein